MLEPMSTPAKCPCCGGPNLTRPGKVEASGNQLHRAIEFDDGTWSGGAILVYLEGVICGDCGYTMLFARPDDLRKLREQWAQASEGRKR